MTCDAVVVGRRSCVLSPVEAAAAGEITLQGGFCAADTVGDVKRRLFAAEAAAGQAVRIVAGGRELRDEVPLLPLMAPPHGGSGGVLRLHAALGMRGGPPRGAAAPPRAAGGPGGGGGGGGVSIAAAAGSVVVSVRHMLAVFGLILSLGWYGLVVAAHMFSAPARGALFLFTLLWLRPAAAAIAPCGRAVARWRRGQRP